jgi:hypothetical protein
MRVEDLDKNLHYEKRNWDSKTINNYKCIFL